MKRIFRVLQNASLILFGITLAFVLVEGGMRLTGNILDFFQEAKNKNLMKQRGVCRILCLGESTTASMPGIISYPAYLQTILNENNARAQYVVINKGVFATNTTNIVTNLNGYLNEYRPDVVITMMGVNDNGPHMRYEKSGRSGCLRLLRYSKVVTLVRYIYYNLKIKILDRWIRIQGIYIKKESRRELKQGIRKGDGEVTSTRQVQSPESPKSPTAYGENLKQGYFYSNMGRWDEAEEAYKRAIDVDSSKNEPYQALAIVYGAQGRFDAEAAMYEKAIEVDPSNGLGYAGLAWHCLSKGDFERAEKLFKKNISLFPAHGSLYVRLAEFYGKQRKYDQAVKILRSGLVNASTDVDKLYGALTYYYRVQNNFKLATECLGKANEYRTEFYDPVTRNNYLRLSELLRGRKVKYVCMQYPMRSIKPLKKLFEDTKDIVFVDNERIFNEAVLKSGYSEYFLDQFAGDFGHSTTKGNRLLAENIAKVLREKVF